MNTDLPTGWWDATARGRVDAALAIAAWDAAVGASEWGRPPVWLHGDLLPGNLLVRDGRLSAVIDFGPLAVGDPAIDLLPAWSVLDADTRGEFRSGLDVDEASWLRGWGWALTIGLVALPYYEHTNPAFAAVARHVLDQALAAADRFL